MKYYKFLQKSSIHLPSWIQEKTDCFILEEENKQWFYIPLTSLKDAEELLKANCFISYEETTLDGHVDWKAQWAAHSPHFKEEGLQIDLSTYSLINSNSILHLNAGPGFGDLSHPTTRLTLSMMAPHVRDKTVYDIGCGSGVLSLAALFLGAPFAYGIDIDPQAIDHAKENAILNHLEDKVSFLQPDQLSSVTPNESVIVMNMIRSQQELAWSSLPQLHSLSTLCFTSGILASEKKSYISDCYQKGWKLIKEYQEENWMGFSWKI